MQGWRWGESGCCKGACLGGSKPVAKAERADEFSQQFEWVMRSAEAGWLALSCLSPTAGIAAGKPAPKRAARRPDLHAKQHQKGVFRFLWRCAARDSAPFRLVLPALLPAACATPAAGGGWR